MKCRVCGGEATIKLNSYNLKICEKDFLRFFEKRVEGAIREYRMFTHKERILVAVSGGKDSLVLWEVLSRLGYHTTGYHLNLNIPGASELAQEKVENFARSRGQELIIEHLSELLGAGIERASRVMKKPACSVCGMVKRYRFNRLAGEKGFSVVATGHHLDDECATLLGNILHWQEGYLARQYPVLEEKEGLVRRAKPLVYVGEEEIKIYARIREIDFTSEPCPYSKGATSLVYKRLIQELERQMPSTKIYFLKAFFKKYQQKFQEPETRTSLHPCPECGYLTVGEICNFCSLRKKLLKVSSE